MAGQDPADDYVRQELMPGPIDIDRLTAHARLRRRTSELPAAHAPRRRALRRRSAGHHRRAGRRHAVVGQEDMIIDVAAALAAATR